MLGDLKESEFVNSNTTNLSLNPSESYINTIEYRNIKQLIEEDSLIYVTEYLRSLLHIKKGNNLNCFKTKLYYLNTSRPKVIIYVRLSVEDIQRAEGNVSKSIFNQLLMLLTECHDKNYEVVGIFYEEDISGSDETRPEWNKTLLFCELGNTDYYLCKSQSRFARSVELVGKYLHKKFIEWDIRFLSIVDRIDTDDRDNKKSSQLTALTDEWDLEKQSVNTKRTLRTKNDAGQWTGSFACYGYIEDPNDMYHLVPDPQAAKVVKKIYELYASGLGYHAICDYLNKQKIPTPSKYKKLQGSNFVCPVAPNGTEYWRTDSIRKILMDETYDGTLIQHRTESISYNIKARKVIPKEKRSIVPNIHERIVPQEISNIVRQKFKDRKEKELLKDARKESSHLIQIVEDYLKENQVSQDKKDNINYYISCLKEAIATFDISKIIDQYNSLREQASYLASDLLVIIQDSIQVLSSNQTRSKPTKNGEVHMFSRKVYCKCCGKVYQKANYKSGTDKKKSYLRCRGKRETNSEYCDNGAIRYEVLEEIVLNELNNKIDGYYNQTKLEKSYCEKQTHLNYKNDIEILKKEKVELDKRINTNENRFTMLYEDKLNGVLTVDEFVMLKAKYQTDIDHYKLRINEINSEIATLESKKDQELNLKTLFEKYRHIEKLDKFIIDLFIRKIFIGKKDPETKKREIKIIWNI